MDLVLKFLHREGGNQTLTHRAHVQGIQEGLLHGRNVLGPAKGKKAKNRWEAYLETSERRKS